MRSPENYRSASRTSEFAAAADYLGVMADLVEHYESSDPDHSWYATAEVLRDDADYYWTMIVDKTLVDKTLRYNLVGSGYGPWWQSTDTN